MNTNNGSVNVFTNYNFGVTIAKMAGRHSVRYGYEHRRYYDNFTSFGGTNVVTFDANPVRQLSGDGGFGSNESNINSMALIPLPSA